MFKNKVSSIVVVALVFIVALYIVNYFKEQKPVKTEQQEEVSLLIEDILDDNNVTETESASDNIPQDTSANLHNIKTLTRVNELRGELSVTEFNEYGDIIYAREEQQEEIVSEVYIEWLYYSDKKVGIQHDGKKIVIELNEENLPVNLNFYDKNDCLTYQEVYEYKNGNISKQENIVCTGEEVFSWVTLIYNEHGDIETVKSSQAAGIDYIITYFYEYDDNGKKTSGYSVENNELSGEITRVLKYTYDENGFLVMEQQFTEEDTLELSIKYKYDEKGNVIEEFYDEPFDYNDKTIYYTYY